MKLFKLIAIIISAVILLIGCTPEGEITLGEKTSVGEGSTVFEFSVIYDGTETPFEVHTDKTTVGEALIELGLLDGEGGPYGLYVKTVNGITLDFNIDGMYWAFYINGEYAMSGVDTTPITEGEKYAFKADK